MLNVPSSPLILVDKTYTSDDCVALTKALKPRNRADFKLAEQKVQEKIQSERIQSREEFLKRTGTRLEANLLKEYLAIKDLRKLEFPVYCCVTLADGSVLEACALILLGAQDRERLQKEHRKFHVGGASVRKISPSRLLLPTKIRKVLARPPEYEFGHKSEMMPDSAILSVAGQLQYVAEPYAVFCQWGAVGGAEVNPEIYRFLVSSRKSAASAQIEVQPVVVAPKIEPVCVWVELG